MWHTNRGRFTVTGHFRRIIVAFSLPETIACKPYRQMKGIDFEARPVFGHSDWFIDEVILSQLRFEKPLCVSFKSSPN